MAEEIKRVFRFIWAWQEEKEEQWLNEMARKGWMLQSYFFGIYDSTAKTANRSQWKYISGFLKLSP